MENLNLPVCYVIQVLSDIMLESFIATSCMTAAILSVRCRIMSAGDGDESIEIVDFENLDLA